MPLAPPPRRSSTSQNDTNKILEQVFEQQQKHVNPPLSVPPKDVFDVFYLNYFFKNKIYFFRMILILEQMKRKMFKKMV